MKDDPSTIVAAIFDKYAQPYAEKYMDVHLYEDSLQTFCSYLPKEDGSILELACGPGNLTQCILHQLPNLKVLATDLSPKMLSLAKKHNPTIEVALMNCSDLLQLHRAFDGIVCGFGLPYLSKEIALKFIDDCAQSLLPMGVLYLSTMEGTYYHSDEAKSTQETDDVLITYYHPAHYLVERLQKNGLEVKDELRITYVDDHGTEVTDLILIAQKTTTK